MRLVSCAKALFFAAPIRFALVCSLVQRLVWALLAWPGMWFQVHLERFWHVTPGGMGYFHTPVQWVDMWARWDAIFYLQLAERGYACAPDYLCTAFFPLFSCLVRGVHDLSGLSYLASGLYCANALDLVGMALVASWFTKRLGPDAGFYAFAAFVAFPTRNFGFSVYTEGLFLALSAGSFLAYEHRRYAVSGVLSALCSASRPQGVLVGVALWVDAVWARVSDDRRRSRAASSMLFAPSPSPSPSPAWPGLVALSLAPVGLAAYMAYLYQTFGDPLMFARVQHVWHRQMQAPWRIIGVHAEPIEYVVLTGALALCIWGLRHRAPVRDSVYVMLSLLVPMCTGRFTSINRFAGVLFPLFALALVMPRRRSLVVLYWCLCAIYTAVFAFKLGQGAKVI